LLMGERGKERRKTRPASRSDPPGSKKLVSFSWKRKRTKMGVYRGDVEDRLRCVLWYRQAKEDAKKGGPRFSEAIKLIRGGKGGEIEKKNFVDD